LSPAQSCSKEPATPQEWLNDVAFRPPEHRTISTDSGGGLASITVTLDRYGHLFPGSEEEAAALLDAYLVQSRERARRASAIDGNLQLFDLL